MVALFSPPLPCSLFQIAALPVRPLLCCPQLKDMLFAEKKQALPQKSVF
jgi:hypothetical protein